MTGFKIWTSGIGSDLSTNWATTTTQSNGSTIIELGRSDWQQEYSHLTNNTFVSNDGIDC